MTKIQTHAHGPATLVKQYEHRDTKEVVWQVKADTGESFHLSLRYVDSLRQVAA